MKVVALTGAIAQLGLVFSLLFQYTNERSEGNRAQMLFESSYTWFKPLNINYHIGGRWYFHCYDIAYFLCCDCRCFGFMDK